MSDYDTIRDLCHNSGFGRPVHQRELKTLMGVSATAKGYRNWPDSGMPRSLIGNTIVWVLPRNEAGKRSHRALCACSHCGRTIPVGRLGQHLYGKRGGYEGNRPLCVPTMAEAKRLQDEPF